ncbi:hypothetical protein GpartN1_g2760.t1 [Galdieria partita]|uniref:MutL C-terminal dimerisation domain-containing protein n=1 Tax=Galdieria partita TaxID=83374 RepID=A0A9C7PVG3_9RHOD|nr:hypothetical protein GpartN1_g2760.t1 [Galdieria partita]
MSTAHDRLAWLFVGFPIRKSPSLLKYHYDQRQRRCSSFHTTTRHLVAQQPLDTTHQVRPLNRQVVEKIHSDEVIQSPMDVVRELLENAIDAQANTITLEWQDEQKRTFRVIDNGMGMSLANLELCIQSHTTSKITSLDDLQHINTLGFRGQALWAIAIYCKSLYISSRPSSEWMGYRLEYSHPNCHIVPVSQDMGTCVQVSLYEAATSQHEKQIRNLFQQYALIYPNVSFRLRKSIHERRPYLVYPKCRHYLERVVQVLNIPSNELRYYQFNGEQQGNSIGHIQVIIGLPERIHRARNDWMWTSINGRISQSIFQELIMEKTKKMIPSGRYPLCFVFIQLKPTYVIWDCSPKKLDVQVKPSIQQDLQKNICYCIDRALDIHDELWKENNASEWTNDRLTYPNETFLQDRYQKWRVAGQLKKTYIVVETDSSVLLLEQHVAHEAILFEKLCELWKSKPEFVSSCRLSSSLLLQGIPQVCIERLQQLHIHTRSLDDMHTWTIDEMPQLIFDILHNSDSWEAQLIRIVDPKRNLEDNLADFACRSAWNNGKELTEFQMNKLVEEWMHLKGNKRTCPHGRPIFIQLDDHYLSRLFKRTWTVDNSILE